MIVTVSQKEAKVISVQKRKPPEIMEVIARQSRRRGTNWCVALTPNQGEGARITIVPIRAGILMHFAGSEDHAKRAAQFCDAEGLQVFDHIGTWPTANCVAFCVEKPKASEMVRSFVKGVFGLTDADQLTLAIAKY